MLRFASCKSEHMHQKLQAEQHHGLKIVVGGPYTKDLTVCMYVRIPL